MSAAQRLELVLDAGSFVEEDATIESVDPLGFRDSKRYGERLRSARRTAGPSDSVKSGSGTIDGQPLQVGMFVFEFMGGSMGSVAGEKITRVFERALERRAAGGGRPACLTPPRCCTGRRAAPPRASPCGATSSSPSQKRRSASPARA